MHNRIPYSRQTIDDADIAAVADCLRSDFLTQGPQTRAFEEAAAAYVGCAHAIAVSNGTAALHLVCQGLGLGPGGLLWTSPNSFVASANAGRYLGADVDFVDIDPQTGSIDPAALETKLAKASANGRKPDILIAVHFAGHSFGFDRVAALCAEHGVLLVEDAAHAFGAVYEDDPQRKVGNHPLSAATTFSFHPLKSITTGEGGMIVTRSDALARELGMLRSHGITKDPAMMTHARQDDGDWYYEQDGEMFSFYPKDKDITVYVTVAENKEIDALAEEMVKFLEENYKEGVLHGKRVQYRFGGIKRSSDYFVNGKLDGLKTVYYDNGFRQEEANYKNGLRDGISRWYNQSEVITIEYEYKAGKLDGPAKTFFYNGKMQTEGQYADDLETGSWKSYDDRGTLVKTVLYEKGKIVKETVH